MANESKKRKYLDKVTDREFEMSEMGFERTLKSTTIKKKNGVVEPRYVLAEPSKLTAEEIAGQISKASTVEEVQELAKLSDTKTVKESAESKIEELGKQKKAAGSAEKSK